MLISKIFQELISLLSFLLIFPTIPAYFIYKYKNKLGINITKLLTLVIILITILIFIWSFLNILN